MAFKLTSLLNGNSDVYRHTWQGRIILTGRLIKTIHTHHLGRFVFLSSIFFMCFAAWIILTKKSAGVISSIFSCSSLPSVPPLTCLSFSSIPPAPPFLSPQAWTSVQTTMAGAPTSAETGELVMSVTAPPGTNSWTKRLVEVKKILYAGYCCFNGVNLGSRLSSSSQNII